MVITITGENVKNVISHIIVLILLGSSIYTALSIYLMVNS
jgi:hypothetical protein